MLKSFVHPSNFTLFSEQSKYLPKSLDELIKQDLKAYEKAQKEKAGEPTVVTEEKFGEDGSIITTTTTTKVETVVVKKSVKTEAPIEKEIKEKPAEKPASPKSTSALSLPSEQAPASGTVTPAVPDDPNTADASTDRLRGRRPSGRMGPTGADTYGDAPDATTVEKGKVAVPHDDPNSVYVGLRVYTHKDAPAVVVGRLKPDPTPVDLEAEAESR
jgi:hypothetical protein